MFGRGACWLLLAPAPSMWVGAGGWGAAPTRGGAPTHHSGCHLSGRVGCDVSVVFECTAPHMRGAATLPPTLGGAPIYVAFGAGRHAAGAVGGARLRPGVLPIALSMAFVNASVRAKSYVASLIEL